MTPETDPGESYVDNFGRSLLGGYSQTYVPDMALHGVPVLDRKKVLSDLVSASQVRKDHEISDYKITEITITNTNLQIEGMQIFSCILPQTNLPFLLSLPYACSCRTLS